MNTQANQALSGQRVVQHVHYDPFRCAPDKARIREAISFKMRSENGTSPRPPTMMESILSRHKNVCGSMLHPGIDEIVRAVGSTPLRIQLLIRWPWFPERYYDISMPIEPSKREPRAELHYRVADAYRRFFDDARDENWQAMEPGWDLVSRRTDLRRLTVVALWHCGGNVFQADVDFHEEFSTARMVRN